MVKLFVIKLTENDEDILLDKMSLLSYAIIERLEKYKVKRDRALSAGGKLMLFTYAHIFKNNEFSDVNLITDYDVFNKESVKNFEITFDEYGKSYVGDNSDIYFLNRVLYKRLGYYTFLRHRQLIRLTGFEIYLSE